MVRGGKNTNYSLCDFTLDVAVIRYFIGLPMDARTRCWRSPQSSLGNQQNMAKYLVTGGAGFIGSHIVHALVARGDQVRVLDNLSTGRRENLAEVLHQIELVVGEIDDVGLVADAVDGIDGIFHEAALASVPLSLNQPLETHRVCVTGTVNLLNQARLAGVRRVVYAASSSCYGDSPEPIKREDQVPQTISPYGAAKLAAEYYCQAFAASFSIEAVCLRYFNVFGPRQDPQSPYSAVIPIFISRLLRGVEPRIYGDGLQSRDFVYVADVVQANLLAMEAPQASGRSFNVGCGRAIDLLTVMNELNSLLGTNVGAIHEPPRPGDIKHSRADISLAQQVLRYQPSISFEEGLRRSIDFYRSII